MKNIYQYSIFREREKRTISGLGNFLFAICFFLLSPLIFISCGKEDKGQKTELAIKAANRALSTRNCQKALSHLNEIDYQTHSIAYILARASSYACFADYSELIFFTEDITLLGTPSVYGSMTRFQSAEDVEDIEDEGFDFLQEAISTLLFAGGQSRSDDPDLLLREDLFGQRAGDLNAAALYMSLVQMGRFLKILGEANSDGEKTRCLLQYDNSEPNLVLYFSQGETGSCTALNMNGPAPLTGSVGDYNLPLLCRGIVLHNTISELIPVVIAAYAGEELDDIEEILDDLNEARDQAAIFYPGLEDLFFYHNENLCAAELEDDQELAMYFYALVFEGLFP